MSAVFQTAFPYADDEMNLPVENVDAAIPFYETVMGFRVVSRNDSPNKSAVLARDKIQIGLAENGGDPTQEGCFFEVNNAEAAFAELKSNGLKKEEADFRIDQHGDKSFKVFFVVAPDGLCYCIGEQQGTLGGVSNGQHR
jgi:catechol 2,3-dioxygenase-like lactoylglutathione lyase family enzyme